MEAKTKGTSPQGGMGARVGRWFMQYAGQFAFLIILFVVLAIASPTFRTPANLINVARQVSVNMIIACAMTMVLIIGGIDLSVGAVMAMAGMVASYLSLAGLPFGVCLAAGLAAGAVSGVVNGVILANTTLPPFIVTYAVQSILRGMVYVITGAGTIRLTSKVFLEFGGGSVGPIPFPVIYMVVIIALSILLLSRSKLGRHMYAIGGNPKAARFAGINTKRIKILIYTLSGVCAALAGLVLTSRNSSMQPAVGNGAEMDAIAAVVLGGTSMAGGRGAIAGTILGAFIIGFINNGLNMLKMDSFYQYICKGVVILIAVYMDYIKNKKLLKGESAS
jgi:ribose transport system permease protein